MFWNSTLSRNQEIWRVVLVLRPAMTLGVIFHKQQSPLITSHCSTCSKLVLKAPLHFWQKNVHKVIYSTYFPQPSNDHRAVNVHNPLEADLDFCLSLRLRCTRAKSLPTPHLCLSNLLIEASKMGDTFHWKFTAKGSSYVPWKFSMTKTSINYWDWDGRSHFMDNFQQVKRTKK